MWAPSSPPISSKRTDSIHSHRQHVGLLAIRSALFKSLQQIPSGFSSLGRAPDWSQLQTLISGGTVFDPQKPQLLRIMDNHDYRTQTFCHFKQRWIFWSSLSLSLSLSLLLSSTFERIEWTTFLSCFFRQCKFQPATVWVFAWKCLKWDIQIHSR